MPAAGATVVELELTRAAGDRRLYVLADGDREVAVFDARG